MIYGVIFSAQKTRILFGAKNEQAMAKGSYEAFAQRFQCEGLEHLHPEERLE